MPKKNISTDVEAQETLVEEFTEVTDVPNPEAIFENAADETAVVENAPEETAVGEGTPEETAAAESSAKEAVVKNKRPKGNTFVVEPDEAGLSEDEKAWQQIKYSKASNTICTGNIASIEKSSDGKDNIVVVMYNGYKISIPGSQMGLSVPKKNNAKDQAIEESRVLARMLGAEIDFVIKDIRFLKEDGKVQTNPHTAIIAASRYEAMLRKRKIFRTFKEDGTTYKVNVGDIFRNARVIATSFKSLFVEAFGVEMEVTKSDISYEWVDDIREKYPVGSTCNIKITSLENRNNPEDIIATASIKATEKSKADTNIAAIREQSKYIAKVTSIAQNYIYLFLSDFGVRGVCKKMAYPGDFPNVGDKVSFVAIKKLKDVSLVEGIVISIISKKK